MLVEIRSLDEDVALQSHEPSMISIEEEEAEALLVTVMPFIDESGRITDIERVKEALSKQVKVGVFIVLFAGLWQKLVEWQEDGARYLSLTIRWNTAPCMV